MDTRTLLATRYRCSSRLSTFCSHGNGRPTRKSCGYCGSVFVIEHGTWSVFAWNETEFWGAAVPERTFASEKVADRWATERKLVVRWVPEITR